ncbi:hypothetical protein H0H81_008629, partial [Sphagnurus paluster]
MSNQTPNPSAPLIAQGSNPLEAVPWPQRKTARTRTYPEEDINILNVHKAAYKRLASTAERGDMFRTKILPDMFNHWKAKGISYGEVAAQEEIK